MHECQKRFAANIVLPQTSIVKTRQTDRWRQLLAISCNKQGIGLGGGGVPYQSRCGVGHLPHWMQNSTSRWLCDCVSSFNNRSPQFCILTVLDAPTCRQTSILFHCLSHKQTLKCKKIECSCLPYLHFSIFIFQFFQIQSNSEEVKCNSGQIENLHFGQNSICSN